MRAPRRVVIVGASLAGLHAARTLRGEGFDGELTLVGEEPHPPYDRPPLSKQVLLGGGEAPDTTLPFTDIPDVVHRFGAPAVRLDPVARTVTLADGGELPWDGLVIATGARARPFPAPRTSPRPVATLRGRDDARALGAALLPGRHVLVIGAGFLGGEIAAAARARDCRVTLVEAAEQPLVRAVGAVAGAFVAGLHREAGVDLRTGTTVTDLRAGPGAGEGFRVTLSDGTTSVADTVVAALGAVPATEWLTDSGLDVTGPGGGVRCDPFLRALRPDGTVVPGVTAAGDVARAPHPLADGAPVLIGHWSNAVEQAAVAVHTLLHPGEPRPYDAVPSFWADLYGVRLRSVGLPARADEVRVVENDPVARRLEVTHHRAGRPVGALTAGRAARLAAHRRELEERRGAPVPAVTGGG
ncbi:NAD(P)/FAD-dependent oxidoreductase [Streptomyces calidiresistens]